MSRGVNKVIVKMYQDGASIPEVSAATGIPRSTVRDRLKRAGALRSRTAGVRIAADKGNLGSGMRGRTRIFSAQHKENIARARKRHAESYALGKSVKPSGYVEITRGKNKGRGEHRIIMEQMIGRPLCQDEHVHHIDGNRANNTPDNLAVMTRTEHARHHAKENVTSRQRDMRGRFI